MYWSDSISLIDTLLSQSDVTLASILDDDSVLQECISNNKNLVAFLSDDSNLTEMLSLITHEPSISENEQERFKHSHTVCEILTYEGNSFADIIMNNTKYINQLWSFVSLPSVDQNDFEQATNDQITASAGTLQSTTRLNPLLASFFAKVFHYLFSNRPDSMIDYLVLLKPPNDLVSVVIRHLDTSAIMDLIFKSWELVNTDKNSPERSKKYNDLLLKNCFVQKLIDLFRDKEAGEKQTNAANLISEFVRVERELLSANSEVGCLLSQLETTEMSRNLLYNILEARSKYSIVNGLKVIQDLLVYHIQMKNMIMQQDQQLSNLSDEKKVDDANDLGEGMPTFLKSTANSPTNEVQFVSPQLVSPIDASSEHLSRCVKHVCTALNERLDDFISILKDPGPSNPIRSTAGLIKVPLGQIRLEVIHLFVALFATADLAVLEKCAQLKVLPLLTDLFFEYSLNNQLHKYYEQIIEYLFRNYVNFKNIHDKHKANGSIEVETDITIAITQTETAPKQEQPISVSEPLQQSSSELENNENNDENICVESTVNEEKEDKIECSTTAQTPPTNEKISRFIQLYHISKVLVNQVIVECRLIERILQNYSHEDVPLPKKMSIGVPEPVLNTPDFASQVITKHNELENQQPLTQVNTDDSSIVNKEEENAPAASVGDTQTVEVNESVIKSDKEAKQSVNNSNEQCSTEQNETKQDIQVVDNHVSKKVRIRPGYMGHLQLIANVLRDRCSEELLSQLDEELIQQWNEFKIGKLEQFNQLIASKLAPEQDYEQMLLKRYKIESISQNLPEATEPFSSAFTQSSSNENEQLSLMSTSDFDFDKYWREPNDKLHDFEKYFDEKCSSIFDEDEDDNDVFGLSNSGPNEKTADVKMTHNVDCQNQSSRQRWPQTQSLRHRWLRSFPTLEDPFLIGEDLKEENDDSFANFGQMNPNPWNDSDTNDSVNAAQTWSADFLSDPFVSSETNSTIKTELVDAEFTGVQVNTSSSPKLTNEANGLKFEETVESKPLENYLVESNTTESFSENSTPYPEVFAEPEPSKSEEQQL